MEEQVRENRKPVKTRRNRLLFMTKAAVLAALSVILMYLNFPVIPGFSFLRLDFAAIPVLVGGFLLGPLAAFVIEVVKILFTLLNTYSLGIGELSNFICSIAFVLPPALIYKYRKNFKWACFGLAIGLASEVAVSALSNYFFIFPLYIKTIGAEAVLGTLDLGRAILFVVIPFNLLKTAIAVTVTLMIYKPLSKLFKRFS